MSETPATSAASQQDAQPAARPRGAGSLLSEAGRRGVLRVATSYAVIAWLVIQIGATVFEPLGLPPWALTALIIAAALGFPVAVALAWLLEIGPRGVERDTGAIGATRPRAIGVRRYADVIIIGLLLVVIGVLLAQGPAEPSPALRERAVAVRPFASVGASPNNEILAVGIPETVLHQLAGLPDIEVVARSSSFGLPAGGDARAAGRVLNARYLVEGTVQSDAKRLRVTAQLIDATTGAELWSLRFDRTLEDVFAVQDEIAKRVALALEVSLESDRAGKPAGGTRDLNAYLEFLDARAALADWRVAEVPVAMRHLERAIAIDANFADAYALLASAELRRAEFEITGERELRFASALERAEPLLARALKVDPQNVLALTERAYLESFTDLASAEADYRRVLELNPSSARACVGLASVLFETSSRREEALDLIERARRLDPLEPSHDVLKATFLLYGPAEAAEARAILERVLERNEDYLPALARLAEVRRQQGAFADSTRRALEVLARDPMSDQTRRVLLRNHLDMGDRAAAAAALQAAPGDVEARSIPLLVFDGALEEAAAAAARAFATDTVTPIDRQYAAVALRVGARRSGRYAEATETLARVAGVTWDGEGRPQLTSGIGLHEPEVGLADLLIQSGQRDRGEALLRLLLDRMDAERDVAGRGEMWEEQRAVALALLGRTRDALELLERRERAGLDYDDHWLTARLEPAFEPLRGDARFRALVERRSRHAARERALLRELRP